MFHHRYSELCIIRLEVSYELEGADNFADIALILWLFVLICRSASDLETCIPSISFRLHNGCLGEPVTAGHKQKTDRCERFASIAFYRDRQ